MMTALMLVPVVVVVGLGVDYGQVSTVRSSNQNALDAAVMAGALMDKDTSDTARRTRMQEVFLANGGKGQVALTSVMTDTQSVGVRAKASFDAPTYLMGLIGRKAVPTTVLASVNVPMKVTTALLKIDMAKGRWDKLMTMYGKIDGDPTSYRLAEIEYHPVGELQDWGNSTVATFDAAGNRQQVSSTEASVKIGKYDEIVMQMEITASDARVKRDFLGSIVNDSLTTAAGYQLIYPRKFLSTDKTLAHRMYITKQVKDAKGNVTSSLVIQNTGTDLLSRLGCDETEKQSWEDGGSYVNKYISSKKYSMVEGSYNSWEGASTLAGKERATDFRYFLTGKCEVAPSTSVRFTE